MNPQSDRLWGIVVFMQVACLPGPDTPSPDVQAQIDLHHLRGAIEFYWDSTGRFPASLSDVCASEVGDSMCPRWPVGRRFVDPWNQPFHYERLDQRDYTIEMSGPDRHPGTADDVRFRFGDELKWVRVAAGCYEIKVPWWKEYPNDQLVLDTVRVAPGQYEAYPAVPHYHGPSWQALDSARLEVGWLQIHHAVVFDLEATGDSLVGHVRSGQGLGNYWGPRFREHALVAHRVACSQNR